MGINVLAAVVFPTAGAFRGINAIMATFNYGAEMNCKEPLGLGLFAWWSDPRVGHPHLERRMSSVISGSMKLQVSLYFGEW